MADSVTLDLTIGEVSTSTEFPTKAEAISAVIDAFLANFPDEDEVFGLEEPVEEDDLRAFITGLQLDRQFRFTIE